MRKVTLYKFDELSEQAQKKAIQSVRDHWSDRQWFWGDEAIKSLEKLCEAFNSKLTNYSIDWFNASQSNVSFDVSNTEETWTKKNIKKVLDSLGSYNKKTLKGLGDCKLTGVCFDESAIDGVRIAFMKDGITNIKMLLYAGYKEWLKDCQSDAEESVSDEGIKREIIEGDYNFEFTKNGDLIVKKLAQSF